MIRQVFLVGCIALLLDVRAAAPTTVLPIRFDDLISKAEVIFVGEVVDSRSMYDGRRDAQIVTVVIFDVIRVLKGHVGLRTQLEFLGGSVGTQMLEVSGMPKFQIGDRDVLFVSSQRNALSPLVGFWQGRFRILRDATTGEEQIRAHNGVPVSRELGTMTSAGAATFGSSLSPGRTGASLSLNEFESLIRDKLQQRKLR